MKRYALGSQQSAGRVNPPDTARIVLIGRPFAVPYLYIPVQGGKA